MVEMWAVKKVDLSDWWVEMTVELKELSKVDR